MTILGGTSAVIAFAQHPLGVVSALEGYIYICEYIFSLIHQPSPIIRINSVSFLNIFWTWNESIQLGKKLGAE